jgi:hypothetical protein
MRKSFILSLVMVVVLIASLATATFAWYTAQTAVQATEVTVNTAKVANNIVIDDEYIDELSYTGKTVTLTFTGSATGIQPMIPTTAPVKDSTTLEAFTFTRFNLDDGKVANKESATPARFNVGESGANVIYIANTGSTEAAYEVNVTITNVDANDGLRVALFVLQGAEEDPDTAYEDGDYTLVGVWAPSTKKVAYQSATFGNGSGVVDGLVTGAETEITASTTTAPVLVSGTYAKLPDTLAAGVDTNDQFIAIAWFEGGTITNDFQNKTAKFELDFKFGATGVGPAA